ncbi:hypothetical protein HYT56_04790 [Candidatus Woesearchaeota archaeon]|nr:hypothetical protein [Candidatus Woesearchaeota archaeon]
MKQINLKLPDNLLQAAQNYIDNFGFRNIQELATESIREKVFEKNEFDETFTKEEIKLIDALIEHSIKDKKIVSEKELMKVLRE